MTDSEECLGLRYPLSILTDPPLFRTGLQPERLWGVICAKNFFDDLFCPVHFGYNGASLDCSPTSALDY